MEKKYEDFVYKFSSTACEDPTTCRAFGLIRKLVEGKKLSTGTDDGFDGWKHKDEKGDCTTKPGYDSNENDYLLFTELWHSSEYRTGIIKQAGWIFDFRSFFKLYLVKTKYYGWKEQYAPNKTFIRKCATIPSRILKIIELED